MDMKFSGPEKKMPATGKSKKTNAMIRMIAERGLLR
jgi:hypothetical protein